MLAAPVRGPEPEPVLVLTLNSQACKVKAMRAKRGGGRVQYVFGWRTLVVGCLAWLFVGLPLVACALGWVLR